MGLNRKNDLKTEDKIRFHDKFLSEDVSDDVRWPRDTNSYYYNTTYHSFLTNEKCLFFSVEIWNKEQISV
jgi:hypothetical protein